MRDESHLDYDLDADAPSRRGRWAAALGGVVALSMLGGLVVWSYRLGVRDPNEVPVIRAAAGSHKARPEDPGGATFDHQGRGIYAAMSGAAAGPAEITLAPPPEALAEEDAPNAELTAGNGVAEAAPVLEGASELDLLVAAALEEQPAVAGAAAPAAMVEPTALAPLAAPVAPPRPSGGPAPSAAEATPAAIPASLGTPAPAPIPTAAAVQLGAYLTEDVARQMWGDLQRRYGDVLDGRTSAIAPIERDGRTLFGLRAVAFADAAEARALCAALRSRGGDCFVTLPR